MAGRPPTYRPRFPETFVQEAELYARRKTASYRLVQHSQLILLLHQTPELGEEEAGRRVGRSGRQARHWCKRWAWGIWSLADALGRGREASFPPPDHEKDSRGNDGRQPLLSNTRLQKVSQNYTR